MGGRGHRQGLPPWPRNFPPMSRYGMAWAYGITITQFRYFEIPTFPHFGISRFRVPGISDISGHRDFEAMCAPDFLFRSAWPRCYVFGFVDAWVSRYREFAIAAIRALRLRDCGISVFGLRAHTHGISGLRDSRPFVRDSETKSRFRDFGILRFRCFWGSGMLCVVYLGIPTRREFLDFDISRTRGLGVSGPLDLEVSIPICFYTSICRYFEISGLRSACISRVRDCCVRHFDMPIFAIRARFRRVGAPMPIGAIYRIIFPTPPRIRGFEISRSLGSEISELRGVEVSRFRDFEPPRSRRPHWLPAIPPVGFRCIGNTRLRNSNIPKFRNSGRPCGFRGNCEEVSPTFRWGAEKGRCGCWISGFRGAGVSGFCDFEIYNTAIPRRALARHVDIDWPRRGALSGPPPAHGPDPGPGEMRIECEEDVLRRSSLAPFTGGMM